MHRAWIAAATLSAWSLAALVGWLDAFDSVVRAWQIPGAWAVWTHAGDTALIWMAVPVAAWAWYQGKLRNGLLLGLLVAGVPLAVFMLKAAFGMPRPPGAPLQSLAYPSGHTALAATLFVLVPRAMGRLQRLPPWLPALGVLPALAVGWSRIALGVHWPKDVVGAWLLAWVAWELVSHWLPAPVKAARGGPAASKDTSRPGTDGVQGP